MSVTNDNQFEIQTNGQADWDSGLRANFNILERGFHLTALAGDAVSTGDVLWMNSGGYLFRFNVLSEDIRPRALAFTAAASGESFQVLLRGIVRSLGVHSLAQMGADLFVSAASPGMIARSYSGASRKIGWGVGEWGFYFDPGDDFLSEKITNVATQANAVVGTDYFFSMDAGRRGWNRRLKVNGNSANLVSIKFHSNSSRAAADRLYETTSGGVSIVGSYIDQAGWPYEATDPSTLNGLVYGTLRIMSGAGVTSDHIGVQAIWDRHF